MNYRPDKFNSLYFTENGQNLWKLLNNSENIIRMETATYLSKPAVEPLSPILSANFGVWASEDRSKQMTGHMVRQIMEARGYFMDRSNVRITSMDNIFVSGTRYTTAQRRTK